MGINVYPVASSVSTTSSIMPVNASVVLLDGSLTSGSTYTTTINGNGGPAYLSAGPYEVTATISGTAYVASAYSSVLTKSFGLSTSVTVSASGFSNSAPSTFISSTMPSSSAWTGIAYGNGYWIAGNATSGGVGAISTNGKTWTALSSASSKLYSMAYGTFSGTGYFVTIAGNTTTGPAQYSTNNGTTWTSVNMPAVANYYSFIAYGTPNGTPMFVATGNSNNNGAYSTNGGQSWTNFSWPSPANSPATITFGNGTFVAANGYGNAQFSTNGYTWTVSNLPGGGGGGAGYNWDSSAYGNGTFVLGSNNSQNGSSNILVYSTNNGVTWNTVTPFVGISAGTYGNGYFVFVGSGGAIYYSSNGITWSAGTLPTTDTYGQVVYGNGVFATLTQSSAQAGYYSFPQGIPTTFGIYQGPKTVN